MVILPPGFTAIRYPGYFWDTKNKELYSIKQGGVLHKMKRIKPNYWNHEFNGYQISHEGIRRNIPMYYLEKLQLKDSMIPMEKK